MRIELVEAESRATAARTLAHAKELAITRRQQQIAFDREQMESMRARGGGARRRARDARRAARAGAAGARGAAAGGRRGARRARSAPAQALAEGSEAYEIAHREIEGLEADVEAARSEVFSAINSATALRHSLEHAARGARSRRRDAVEAGRRAEDIRVEYRAGRDGARPMPPTGCAWRTRPSRRRGSRVPRASRSWPARASSTSGARDRCAPASRSSPGSTRGCDRSRSSTRRAPDIGDGARAVLAQANGQVGQQGAVADYLEVDSRLRARGRGMPRRSAAARRRRAARPGGGGPRAGAREECRALRLRRRRRRRRPPVSTAPPRRARRRPTVSWRCRRSSA